MAIGLPPPQTPQMGDLYTLRDEASGALEFDYDLYHVHISGNSKLPDAELKRRFLAADNVSDAVRTIAKLYYRAGYPLTQVLYAVSGSELYIHVAIKAVDKVEAPAPLAPYLDGLADGGPLTASRLEPKRLLANLAAERGGMESNLRIVNQSVDSRPDYVLIASGGDDAHIVVHGTLDYGNIGNRYVGRDIADATLLVTTPFGDKLNVGAISSVQGYGIGDYGSFYREINVDYDRDSPYGVFGVEGRYAPFSQIVEGFKIREDIQQFGASWLMPVYADFQRRLLFQFHALRSSFAAELAQYPGPDLRSELYTALEGGLVYEQSLGDSGHWRFGSSLLVSHGLGPRSSSLTPAQLDYLLYRPSAHVTYSPDSPWTMELSVSGQYSNDTVPQTQQWVLGGLNQIAAYRAGVAIGDTGALVRFGVAYKDIPLWLFRFTPSSYAEYGFSRLAQALPDQARQPSQSLADVGVSLLAKLGSHLAATASIAEDVYDHNTDPAVLHSFRATYFFRVSVSF